MTLAFIVLAAGLLPAIHSHSCARSKDVDARHKAGHDKSLALRRTPQRLFFMALEIFADSPAHAAEGAEIAARRVRAEPRM